MDKTIRRNENCIIGLPRCDFVFSSTRSCFIGFGFKESTLEMSLLRHLLIDRDIEPTEASGSLAPGQNAFCLKICSKIITSQFCIILLNNDEKNGTEIPNANVNMEYGLMLGFNKYIIPFQKETQKLPFNVAGLDTIKYSAENFESKAKIAIDLAIDKTRQEGITPIQVDQYIESFLLSKKTLVSSIRAEGDRLVFELGSQFGFNLLTDFSGFSYIYLGNFTNLRPEVILWRLKMLEEILKERVSNMPERLRLGIATPQQVELIEMFMKKLQVWVITTNDTERDKIKQSLTDYSITNKIFSLNDIHSSLKELDDQLNARDDQN